MYDLRFFYLDDGEASLELIIPEDGSAESKSSVIIDGNTDYCGNKKRAIQVFLHALCWFEGAQYEHLLKGENDRKI